MANRDVRDHYPRRRARRATSCCASSASRRAGVDDVSFVLRRGEIVGLAGLLGAGRTELARMIVGADPVARRRIVVGGRHAHRRAARGDRGRHRLSARGSQASGPRPGAVGRATTSSLPHLVRWSRVGRHRSPQRARQARRLGRRPADQDARVAERVAALSGGKQQKVVLARWLAARADILIMDEPTRGVDVAAQAGNLRADEPADRAGAGRVMISSELPEVLGMSDRIYVMRRGRGRSRVRCARPPREERVLQAALGLAS